MPEPPLRIGELARRTGVTPDTLRKWERRYGLLRPARTAGGLRVYDSDDERRVHAMLRLRQSGVAAAEAAATLNLAADQTTELSRPSADRVASALVDALTRYDATQAHRVLDDVFGRLTLRGACQQVILPALRSIGERWRAGSLTIAEEHFASSLVRERLLAAARGWSSGDGRHALLAGGSGDLHDIGLICLGAVLHQQGWRITFLGADTPTRTITQAATRLAPTIVVIAVTTTPVDASDPALAMLAASTRLFLAGPAARRVGEQTTGATLLGGDPVSAADRLTQLVA